MTPSYRVRRPWSLLHLDLYNRLSFFYICGPQCSAAGATGSARRKRVLAQARHVQAAPVWRVAHPLPVEAEPSRTAPPAGLGWLYSLLLLLLPAQVSRCGLYHSAYSNSYVNLAIFKPDTGRETVRLAVGHDAEELVRSRPHFPLGHLRPLTSPTASACRSTSSVRSLARS